MARDTYCQFSSVALFRVNALVGLPWTTESCSGLPQPVTFTLAISSAQKNTQQESNSQLTFSEFICHLKSLQITCRWNGCLVTTKYIIHALRTNIVSPTFSCIFKQVFNKYQPMYDNYTENLYIPRQLSIKSPIQFSWQSTEHETLHSVSTAHQTWPTSAYSLELSICPTNILASVSNHSSMQ